MAPSSVLVTGANGYIGQAVARAFRNAGYTTYGLIRSSSGEVSLQRGSIIPIVGSAAHFEQVLAAIMAQTKTLDVIVSTTEDRSHYVPHFNNTMGLLRALAIMSTEHGVRPLVLFTSGCKDYGQGELDGSPHLKMHTEQFPLNPPPFLTDRATYAVKVLEEPLFDAAVLRPTLVHGGSSSHLGRFFDWAKAAKSNKEALRFNSDPRTIVHSMNVDTCAEAYVALANHPNRAEVAGECFNISAGRRYETLRDIANVLVETYRIEDGVDFTPPSSNSIDAANALTNFSQYVGSEKIRNLTKWTDSETMFAQDVLRYRKEYEDQTSREVKRQDI